MSFKRRVRRRIDFVRVGERGIVVHSTGGSPRQARWIYSVLTSLAAGYLWVQSGIVVGVAFAALAGLFQVALTPNNPPRGEAKPVPSQAWIAFGGGCLWVTVSSAVFVALIMRTVGVPFLQGAATCYVIVIGLSGFAEVFRMAKENAAAASSDKG